jgi:hypothetical protein
MSYFLPSKRIHWTAKVKNVLAILACLFLFPHETEATTVVMIITHQNIVIGADGKTISADTVSEFHPGTLGTAKKIALIENRIAIAQAGSESLRVGEVTIYSFSSLVQYLQSNSSSKTTVAEIVVEIKQRIPQMFCGFDILLKTGLVKREAIPPPGNILLQFYVAGFEQGHPVAYLVQSDIDWSALHLNDPAESTLYPNSNPERKHSNIFWIGGKEHGIVDLKTGTRTDQTRTLINKMPTEVKTLLEDEDITLGQMLLLERGLLDLEVTSNPDTIGYPLAIFTITESKAEEYAYKDQGH